MPADSPAFPPARAFAWAWGFWTIAALLGVLLRWHGMRPIPGFEYAYTLHAHSHVAFLGWVFNGFFALALQVFVPTGDSHRYRRLFWTLQVAVAGMLVAYPVQGYARESIIFSTLHLVCAGVFTVRLLRRNVARPVARRYLVAAFACMLLSGIGPLTLGPLAAMGMRESPWYLLCIYFYLHFQYNGWFILYLIAVLVQRWETAGTSRAVAAAARAWHWLIAGTLLSFALSALWMSPSAWVYAAAVAGGAALLVATVLLIPALREFRHALGRPVPWVGPLFACAALLFAVKHGLQFAGAWPELALIAGQRTVVIGFLHLIFLGIVTPALIGWAMTFGWLPVSPTTRVGIVLFGLGAVATELTLLMPAALQIAGTHLPPPGATTLFASAVVMAMGVVVIAAQPLYRRR